MYLINPKSTPHLQNGLSNNATNPNPSNLMTHNVVLSNNNYYNTQTNNPLIMSNNFINQNLERSSGGLQTPASYSYVSTSSAPSTPLIQQSLNQHHHQQQHPQQHNQHHMSNYSNHSMVSNHQQGRFNHHPNATHNSHMLQNPSTIYNVPVSSAALSATSGAGARVSSATSILSSSGTTATSTSHSLVSDASASTPVSSSSSSSSAPSSSSSLMPPAISTNPNNIIYSNQINSSKTTDLVSPSTINNSRSLSDSIHTSNSSAITDITTDYNLININAGSTPTVSSTPSSTTATTATIGLNHCNQTNSSTTLATPNNKFQSISSTNNNNNNNKHKGLAQSIPNTFSNCAGHNPSNAHNKSDGVISSIQTHPNVSTATSITSSIHSRTNTIAGIKRPRTASFASQYSITSAPSTMSCVDTISPSSHPYAQSLMHSHSQSLSHHQHQGSQPPLPPPPPPFHSHQQYMQMQHPAHQHQMQQKCLPHVQYNLIEMQQQQQQQQHHHHHHHHQQHQQHQQHQHHQQQIRQRMTSVNMMNRSLPPQMIDKTLPMNSCNSNIHPNNNGIINKVSGSNSHITSSNYLPTPPYESPQQSLHIQPHPTNLPQNIPPPIPLSLTFLHSKLSQLPESDRLTFTVNHGNLWGPQSLRHGDPTTEITFTLTQPSLQQISARPDLDIVITSFLHRDPNRLCHWPEYTQLKLNGQLLNLDTAIIPAASINPTYFQHHQPPTDLKAHTACCVKQFCKLGNNNLHFTVSKCICCHFFHAYMVHRPTVQYAVESVQTKSTIPSSVTISLIANQNVMSLSREMTSAIGPNSKAITISLICPLSQTRLIVPARTKLCKHIQTFDLLEFFKLQTRWPQYMCPICRIRIMFNLSEHIQNIVVDDLIKSVLTKVDKSVNSILLYPDGTWKPSLPDEIGLGECNNNVKSVESIILNNNSISQPSPPKRSKVSINKTTNLDYNDTVTIGSSPTNSSKAKPSQLNIPSQPNSPESINTPVSSINDKYEASNKPYQSISSHTVSSSNIISPLRSAVSANADATNDSVIIDTNVTILPQYSDNSMQAQTSRGSSDPSSPPEFMDTSSISADPINSTNSTSVQPNQGIYTSVATATTSSSSSSSSSSSTSSSSSSSSMHLQRLIGFIDEILCEEEEYVLDTQWASFTWPPADKTLDLLHLSEIEKLL